MGEPYSDSTEMNFSWLEESAVAGCRGPRTAADLMFLASVGIRALVRLAHEDETGITAADVQQHEIDDCYEPVKDWTAPSQEQIDRVVYFVNQAVANGKAVAVSCGAGYGRTGTILGCYLVSKGLSADEALRGLIEARPCSREVLRVPGQKEAVVEFHRRTQHTKGKDAV
jgi:atypical dual specificity phosphatase